MISYSIEDRYYTAEPYDLKGYPINVRMPHTSYTMTLEDAEKLYKSLGKAIEQVKSDCSTTSTGGIE